MDKYIKISEKIDDFHWRCSDALQTQGAYLEFLVGEVHNY